ncbi:hypothetical protein B7486_19260 [cyanobacterium TDX16]|nr:hypothetical protein B7486_19260 [cyanobacterium TDX16]
MLMATSVIERRPGMPKETAREPGVMDYDYTAAAGSRQTYLHGNLIGTTEATTSASAGSPPSGGRAVYTAFGERVYANGVGGGRYGYAGAWGYQAAGTEQCGPVGETYSCDPLEELGWLHVGERYYDPACGRFVQRDPIGIRGGFNVYVYVGNAPTLGIDPSGRMSVGTATTILDWTGGSGQTWLDNPTSVRNASLAIGLGGAALPAAAMGYTIAFPGAALSGLLTMPLNGAVVQVATCVGTTVAYTGEGLKRAIERGVPPSVTSNAIQNGIQTLGNRPGTFRFVVPGEVTVITNTFTGNVITVYQSH